MTNYIELNNLLTQKGPDGFFDLAKDKEAVDVFLRDEVEAKMVYFRDQASRVRYLVHEGYYESFYEKYSPSFVHKAFVFAEGFDFKFQSYMAASKFYTDYAMRTNDGKKYLERYSDRVTAVALHLGRGDEKRVESLIRAMMEQRVQPATPTFLNAGKARRGELVSCFLLEMDDSLNSINHVLATCMQLSKIGGGVAVNLSKLRGRGEAIKGVEGAAKGISPVLKLMEDAFSYADQMGQRKGSGAGYYNIFGWDVLEFLDSKKINADEKARLKTLSIGLIVPNKFYDLAEKNQDLYVFAPYSVRLAYGEHLDDMDIDQMYDTLMADDRVKKKRVMTAREMLVKIATVQLESGYPYIMNKTNANKFHALKDLGQVKMSNLCTEIYQLQETSTINDYGMIDEIRRDISCNLASLNIANVMEKRSVEDSTRVAVRGLTSVSDQSSVQNAPGVALANDELHSIGLGAMNLHGYLAKNRVMYDSDEAVDFANTFFMMMNYYSLDESCEIARERRQTFKGFEKSEYAKGTYFDKYVSTDYSPKTDKVKQLFQGIYVPDVQDWAHLKERVQEHGLYHAYRLAIAPTQSISYVQNATSSVMPIVDLIETRTYANSTTYYPAPFLTAANQWYYRSAYTMNQFRVLHLIATIQEHIDQGISAILHVNSDVETNELARYYLYAARIGLKGLYYTRTNKIDEAQFCVQCAI